VEEEQEQVEEKEQVHNAPSWTRRARGQCRLLGPRSLLLAEATITSRPRRHPRRRCCPRRSWSRRHDHRRTSQVPCSWVSCV